jgi:hypothetical protein
MISIQPKAIESSETKAVSWFSMRLVVPQLCQAILNFHESRRTNN